jgi:hypothetical protein
MVAIIEDRGGGGLRGNPGIAPGSPTDQKDQLASELTAASASTMPAP